MTLLDNMPHTATVFSHTYTRSTTGGTRRAEVENVVGIAVWVQNASQAQIIEFAKRDQIVTHKIYYTPGDVTLKVGDTFLVTLGPSYVQTRFKHVADADRSAGLGCVRMAMVEQFKNIQSNNDEN